MAKIRSDKREAGVPANIMTEERAFDIRIDRDGVWHHEGRPIRRADILRLFAAALSCDAAGRYWLSTAAERGTIVVDDAPFLAVLAERSGNRRSARIVLQTNLGESVQLDDGHRLRIARDVAGPRPYVLLRDGLEARLTRPVFYTLADWATTEGGRLGVWSCGLFHPLEEPEADDL